MVVSRGGPVELLARVVPAERIVPAGRVGQTAMVGPDARYVQDPWSRLGRFYVIRWKFENTQRAIKINKSPLKQNLNKLFQRLSSKVAI